MPPPSSAPTFCWTLCGRYYRKSDKQKIAEAFHATKVDVFVLPPWDYNVAPTSMQPIIRSSRDTGERELVSMRWGLVPFFAIDLKAFKGFSTINARAETITTSRTYREPFKKRRCLVPRPPASTSGRSLTQRTNSPSRPSHPLHMGR
ncbi:SOS response-associated peptidase family protein [Edaphobacter aggregans]|uniref:SOS response-associated peptidase family protein n=1 Tax=Edaphobacter aggregans TaxID=570835 RepID=UPI001FE1699C|nr:SOS response-associated peptidase family protein [Edaphobacter aggregans]